jgi:hypothetical protein
MDLIFSLLVLLQIKHWLVDFVLQTDEEIQWGIANSKSAVLGEKAYV